MSDPGRCQCGAVLAGRHRAEQPSYMRLIHTVSVSLGFSFVTFLAILVVLIIVDRWIL